MPCPHGRGCCFGRRPACNRASGAGVLEAPGELVVPGIDPLPAVVLAVPVGDSLELRGELPVVVAPRHLELALDVGQHHSAEGVHPLPEPCGVGLGVDLCPLRRADGRAQLPVDCVPVVDVVARCGRLRHRLHRRPSRSAGFALRTPAILRWAPWGRCAGTFVADRRACRRFRPGRRPVPYSGRLSLLRLLGVEGQRAEGVSSRACRWQRRSTGAGFSVAGRTLVPFR